jgi:hypothetical protein
MIILIFYYIMLIKNWSDNQWLKYYGFITFIFFNNNAMKRLVDTINIVHVNIYFNIKHIQESNYLRLSILFLLLLR